MKATQYTPGPWRLDSPDSLIVTFAGVPVVAALDNCDSREMTQANARLIAAAPELVEALQYLVSADDAICHNRGLKSDQAMNRIAALDMAARALSKAGL